MMPLGAEVTLVGDVPGNLKARPGCQQVAVVSVSALAHERGWYGLIDVPVLWVGLDRPRYQALDPLGGKRVLPSDFTPAELLAMLQEVLPPAVAQVIARQVDNDVVVARSECMTALLDEVMAFAGSDQNVLIQGETGVGKELVARLVHRGHARFSAGPFVAVNCGAVPEGLFESLFFGHAKGAFTGAVHAHKGYLEQAQGGTLFMDEVGDLPPFQQVKLLRVLESSVCTRVGSEVPVQLDFRLVTATNRNLRELVKRGDFRADLFYRLAVIEFNVPNLEQRGAIDKIAIFSAMLSRIIGLDSQGRPIEVPRWLIDQVAVMNFPGNVRQLRNLAERAGVIFQQTGQWTPKLIINALEMVREMAGPVPGAAAQQGQACEQRARIISELDKNGWQRQKTAEQLGMSRKSLWEKMRKFGITGDGEDAM